MIRTFLTLPQRAATSYPIFLDAKIIEVLESLVTHEEQLVIITDHRVKKIYGTSLHRELLERGFHVLLFSFEAGEQSKTSKTKEELELAMLQAACGRKSVIIALGGGVVGDIAGFVAATYLRGIDYIQVPTTLLAMIDSSIGGKTGVNTIYGKNLLGAFWQPRALLIDLDFLKTLSQQQLINGLVEAIKIFLTSDREAFLMVCNQIDLLLEADSTTLRWVIQRALKHKVAIVQRDERESNERMVLNFGHTIGHALEHLSNYKIMHGYAVGLGILVELKISQLLGFLPQEEFNIVTDLFARLKITPAIIAKIDPKDLLRATLHDKKNLAGSTRYVLLDQLGVVRKKGEAFLHFLDDTIVLRALKEIR